MITWMQRHKKYLIITIWISTIAFIGAGFVGWGQYSYGDKAGAVAKVGNIEISRNELQKTYSNLYNQYNQMFKGNFDEAKAKQFGLKRQALQELVQQALILNLASSYNLKVNNKEIYNQLKGQNYFFKNGVFDKETYQQVLSRNNLTMKEYENGIRKELLIRKVFNFFPVKVNANEAKIIDTIMDIADKITYKVLDTKNIKVDTSDKNLKAFWINKKREFMTDVTYKVNVIKSTNDNKKFTQAKISQYYKQNKAHFKDNDGKILPLVKVQKQVIKELDAKASKETALRTYIAYKKDRLSKNIHIDEVIVSNSNNPYGDEALKSIKSLSLTSAFSKPVFVNGNYFIFKLIKINPSRIETFKEAKKALIPMYIDQTKKEKLLALANNSLKSFTGTTTDFITNHDALKLSNLNKNDANEFLIKLFSQKKKKSFITLNSGKVILYNILEQKLLNNSNTKLNDSILRLKKAMFNEGLIKNLQNKYKTEIFIKGL